MPAITDQFVLNWVPKLDADQLRVCIALTMLPPLGAELTKTDLCMRSGVSTSRLEFVLDGLSTLGLMTQSGTSKGVQKWLMSQQIDGAERQFKLAGWSNDEQTIAALHKDKMTLTTKLRRAEDSSDLPDALNLEEGNVARLVEQVLGRAMTLEEAYRFGTMVQAYGPDRVRSAVLSKKKSTNPLYAAAAMLFNGARGQAAPKKDAPKPITYFTPDDRFNPWG